MTDAPEPTKVDVGGMIKDAVSNADVPKIYTNGFGVGLSNADIVIILQRFGNPVAVLNLSYTLAKTLAQKLGGVVADFESKIAGQEILTTDRIDAALSKDQALGKEKPLQAQAPEDKKKTDGVH